MSRRVFLGTASLAALSSRTWAQEPASVKEKAGDIVLPSAFFGFVAPAEVGVHEEVTSRMVSYLQSQIDAGVIPGAFVAAMRHGKVFLEKHFGVYCDRTRRDAPYDGAAIHPFHSISKMVSATAVVMAWQDGLIDIDVPVMRYIPEFRGGGKDAITIRQLLTHSAGIPNNPPPGLNLGTEEQWRAAIAAICAEPVQWEPGTRTEYHALSGLLTAAEAVRRVSHGMTWEQICAERIFIPLGLGSFTFGQPPLELPLACIPRLADPTRQWPYQIAHFLGQPAAGLKGTLTDVLQFLVFQSQKGTWRGKTLLQGRYWDAMHTPQYPVKPGFDSWGLGMMVRGEGPPKGMLGWFGLNEVKGPRIFSHAGTDIVLAVGDPDTDIQILLVVTDTPATHAKTEELRNTVTATVFSALSQSG